MVLGAGLDMDGTPSTLCETLKLPLLPGVNAGCDLPMPKDKPCAELEIDYEIKAVTAPTGNFLAHNRISLIGRQVWGDKDAFTPDDSADPTTEIGLMSELATASVSTHLISGAINVLYFALPLVSEPSLLTDNLLKDLNIDSKLLFLAYPKVAVGIPGVRAMARLNLSPPVISPAYDADNLLRVDTTATVTVYVEGTEGKPDWYCEHRDISAYIAFLALLPLLACGICGTGMVIESCSRKTAKGKRWICLAAVLVLVAILPAVLLTTCTENASKTVIPNTQTDLLTAAVPIKLVLNKPTFSAATNTFNFQFGALGLKAAPQIKNVYGGHGVTNLISDLLATGFKKYESTITELFDKKLVPVINQALTTALSVILIGPWPVEILATEQNIKGVGMEIAIAKLGISVQQTQSPGTITAGITPKITVTDLASA